MSKILTNIHRDVTDLHEAGFIDKATMNKFDELCLPTKATRTTKKIRKNKNKTTKRLPT